MVYDAARGKTLLFGGGVIDAGYGPGSDANDTWVWDGDDWLKLNPFLYLSESLWESRFLSAGTPVVG